METLLMDVELGLEQLLKGLEVQPGSLLLELELQLGTLLMDVELGLELLLRELEVRPEARLLELEQW